jgi:hypothetical protein
MTSNALPNLAGVATQNLVEKIGTGSFSAQYLNWSRTMQLMREHAPGWLVDYIPSKDGSLLHQAPVGAYLLIRFQNMETGFSTPALPQAIMDMRNKSVPFDKITSRDITDTQRRGMCMAAAMHFGLAYELWAKMPLESGYQEAAPAASVAPVSAPKSQSAPLAAATAPTTTEAVPAPTTTSEEAFREAALAKGLTTHAIEGILGVLKGDFAVGVATVNKKTAEQVEGLNQQFAPKSTEDDGSQW